MVLLLREGREEKRGMRRGRDKRGKGRAGRETSPPIDISGYATDYKLTDSPCYVLLV